MTALLLQIFPLALGAAVSPALLTLEFAILAGNTRPRARAWAFVIGAALTIFAFGLLVLAFLRNLDFDQTPSWTSVGVRILIGILLIALGLRVLLRKAKPGSHHHDRLQSRIENARLPFFSGLGVAAMATNASTLVLYLPAVHLIIHASASDGTKIAAAAVLWLITITPFTLPVMIVTLVGRRSDSFLARLNTWTSSNSRRITSGVCFIFAALIMYSAVSMALRLA